ncbi:NADase-type glycan-binding domain-containing protein [Aureivirga sp. CE67]|uniref:NADase-type glycan-binding domain-containing protein n=1 Tax=Aureivirga sp. CE67 TaxID=1788983 RepID=UPI0018C96D39|nr:hypothetical protein [Aureivirga sp. CE67]
MKLKILILTIIFIPLFQEIQQKKEKIIEPYKLIEKDRSLKRRKEIYRKNELQKKSYHGKLAEREKKEYFKLLKKYGEMIVTGWEVLDKGCSWYCGESNYKVVSSSSLKSTNKYDYNAKSANDLSYETAWIEGRNDSGIGEYLEYYFKNGSQSFSRVIISNGYVKSNKSWINNNRVKKIKMYINNEFFAILNLKDTKKDQVFNVGIIEHDKNEKDLILKFEILEVYNGEKYNDTAITEIYFDGDNTH